MAFCNTCGGIIPFAGGVCPRCKAQGGADGQGSGNSGVKSPWSGPAGSQNDKPAGNTPWGSNSGAKIGNFGGNGFFGNVASSGLDKRSLISKLERYKQLLVECEDLKSMIKPQSSFPSSPETNFKTKSFMRYFWPFLVGGIIGGYVIYMIASFMTMQMAIDITGDPKIAASQMLGETLAGLAAGLIVAAAVIFFGIYVSRRKQAEFNKNIEFMNREATERYNQGIKNQKMIDLYQENLNEIYKYEPLVPEEHRTADHLGQIIDILKENRAETVDEACAII